MLGQTDVFGFWAPGPVPYKSYNETIGVTIGPNQVNQTGPLTIRGEEGMEILGCGNYLDNPLGIVTKVEGIRFKQATGCLNSTWYQDVAYNSQHLTWHANLFEGNGESEPAMNGTFDSPIYFADNFLYGQTGDYTVIFTSRTCGNDTFVSVTGNTWLNQTGSSLEVIQWWSLYVNSNTFLNVGGMFPFHVVNINACTNSTGTYVFDYNEIFGQPPTVPCAPLYPAGFYLDPLQYQIKSKFSVKLNKADGQLCVGMQVWNMEPFECGTPDPKFYVRLFILPLLNHRVHGNHPPGSKPAYDILISPKNATFQAFVDADPDETTMHACYWCNDGCPAANLHVLVWVILLIFAILFCIYATLIFCCPGLCFCCDCPNYDSHEEPYIKMEIRDDMSQQPVPHGDVQLFNEYHRTQVRPSHRNPGMVAMHQSRPDLGRGGFLGGTSPKPVPHED